VRALEQQRGPLSLQKVKDVEADTIIGAMAVTFNSPVWVGFGFRLIIAGQWITSPHPRSQAIPLHTACSAFDLTIRRVGRISGSMVCGILARSEHSA